MASKNKSTGAGGALAKLAGQAGKVVVTDIDPLAVLREYLDYRRTADEQETERARILERRDVAVAAISAKKEIILAYFEQRFRERERVLERLFGVLDTAVQTKNEVALDGALEGILGVVKDSPLEDFESFRKHRQRGEIIEI